MQLHFGSVRLRGGLQMSGGQVLVEGLVTVFVRVFVRLARLCYAQSVLPVPRFLLDLFF